MFLAGATRTVDRPGREQLAEKRRPDFAQDELETALAPKIDQRPGRDSGGVGHGDDLDVVASRQTADATSVSPATKVQRVNLLGNWAMIPSLSMSAIDRIPAWTWSYAAMSSA